MWVTLFAACTASTQEVTKAAGSLAHPPVLWISLDTTRADALEVFGGPARTPALATLAADAIVYEHAYSTFSETGLAHWALFTGVLPAVHGNVPAAGDSTYTGPTAAEIAKSAGYKTAAFVGGITMTAAATGLDRGFDSYDDTVSANPEDRKRDGKEVTALATEWMSAQTTPWFLLVHLFDAHFPYTPSDGARYDTDYQGTVDGTEKSLRAIRDDGAAIADRDLRHVRALYDSELTDLDTALAPLLAATPANAIVVVTADHGESFEHGYLFNHRGSLADTVMHIPWVLRVPGTAAQHVATPVSAVDVLPTLAAAAEWPVTAPFMGKSALPSTVTARTLWASTDPWFSFPMAHGWTGPLVAARTDRWKVIWTGDGAAHAFDLDADPGELTEQPPPAELINAKSEYDAAIAGMAAWQKPVTSKRKVGAGEGEMLEALGYTAPAGAPPGPPGPPDEPSTPSPANTPAVPPPDKNAPPFIPPAPGGPQGRAPGTPGPKGGAVPPPGPPDRSGADHH